MTYMAHSRENTTRSLLLFLTWNGLSLMVSQEKKKCRFKNTYWFWILY